MLSDSTILKHITHQPRRSAGFKQLVRELGLHGSARRELDDRLQKLVASGQLTRSDSDHYALPQANNEKNLVAGRLTMHRDGFGFLIPKKERRRLVACTWVGTKFSHRVAEDKVVAMIAARSAASLGRVRPSTWTR